MARTGAQSGEAAPASTSVSGTFVVARNPDGASRLPFLVCLPVEGEGDVVFATRAAWPAGTDLYCHPLDRWPEGAVVVESVPVERCWRSGVAIHLILRRRRARRSLFVHTQRHGRGVVFWRSRASLRAARPGVRVPLARAFAGELDVVVDARERYPWRLARVGVRTRRRELPVGDYALVDGDRVVAAIERKTVEDLAASAMSGALSLALAELATLAHGAVVVEGRLSDLVKHAARAGVRAGWLMSLVAALQVAHPGVAWMFADTRALAEDYAYRWLSACARVQRGEAGGRPEQAPDGEAPASAAPAAAGRGGAASRGARLVDAPERRAVALREALAGTVWTTAAFAVRVGVSERTAWSDLRALATAGLLVAEGPPRYRRYRARASDVARPAPEGT